MLLEKGADVNRADKDKVTPLMTASFKGHVQTLLLLLRQRGIQLNQSDAEGRTALHMAASVGETITCVSLIKAGADVNRVDSAAMNAIALALAEGHTGCAEAIRLEFEKIQQNKRY